MPRADFSPTEIALLNSDNADVHTRFLVEDGDGVLRNTRALGPLAIDFLRALTWNKSRDSFVESGTAELWTAQGTYSLAPLMEASPLNRNAVDDYAPLLKSGRECRIDQAVTDVGAAPVTWHKMFHGRLDRIGVPGKTSIPLAFRDLGGILADFVIPDELDYLSGSLETVIQAMLDDNLGGGVVTLYTPIATGATVPALTIPAGGLLLETINNLVRDVNQWDVRHLYDAGTDTFPLTLSDPRAGAEVADWEMGPTTYLNVVDLTEQVDEVRNIVRVMYGPDVIDFAEASTPGSITDYGPRFLNIARSPLITDYAGAFAKASTIVADTSQPPISQIIETLAWPIAELGDFGNWLANGVHYDSDKLWACQNIAHSFANGQVRTSISVRGARSGGSKTWLQGGSGLLEPSDVIVENVPIDLADIQNLFWLDPAFDEKTETVGAARYELNVLRLNNWTAFAVQCAIEWQATGFSTGADLGDGIAIRASVYDAAGGLRTYQTISLLSYLNPTVFNDQWRTSLAFMLTVDSLAASIRLEIWPLTANGELRSRNPQIRIVTSTFTDEAGNNITPTVILPAVETRAAIAASLAVTTLVNEMELREHYGGTPGAPDRFATLPVHDISGLIQLLDPDNRQLLNLLLASSIVDSGGTAVDRALYKALSSDPNTADSVLDGLLKAVTTLNEKIGAARAYAGFDVSGVIAAGKVVETSIEDDSISTPKLQAAAVTAGKISVAELAALSAYTGDLTAGRIFGPSGLIGMLFNGERPTEWLSYIDWTAVGLEHFIKHGSLELLANGGGKYYGDLINAIISAVLYATTREAIQWKVGTELKARMFGNVTPGAADSAGWEHGATGLPFFAANGDGIRVGDGQYIGAFVVFSETEPDPPIEGMIWVS